LLVAEIRVARKGYGPTEEIVLGHDLFQSPESLVNTRRDSFLKGKIEENLFIGIQFSRTCKRFGGDYVRATVPAPVEDAING
jgi:hypothetical protein